jgi:transposase-like protein
LSEILDEPAVRAFFDKALDISGLPSKVVIDKSKVNTAALDTLKFQLWLSGYMLYKAEATLSPSKEIIANIIENIASSEERWFWYYLGLSQYFHKILSLNFAE